MEIKVSDNLETCLQGNICCGLFPHLKVCHHLLTFFGFSLLFNIVYTHCCSADEEDEIILNVEGHYSRAKVDSCIFNLGDCAYIKVECALFYISNILPPTPSLPCSFVIKKKKMVLEKKDLEVRLHGMNHGSMTCCW
ncbi:DNA (cytosine-5-)-methyltransferase [Sarracenia purpurea var. burkii]